MPDVQVNGRAVRELRKGFVDLCILTLAMKGPVYGQALIDNEVLGTAMRAGTVYPALARLQRLEALNAVWASEPGSRDRKMYHITPTGEAVHSALMREWQHMRTVLGQLTEEMT